MVSYLTVVCHLWPGLTPFNVWDLPVYQWRGFRVEADRWIEAQKG